MEAQIKIDDGFSKEDLSQPAYANRLAEICAIINAQNLCLLCRVFSRDFDPAKELDRSANGAASYLHDLVATIVLYEEGRVPWQVAKSMCESTAALLTALQELPNAPIGELDKAGVAFRLLLDIASRYYPQPSVHRDKYEESLFKAEEQVNSALDKLHEKNIYSLSVLWAERWPGNDWFKNPEDYPLNAFASVGTHDMPPFKMWWFGYEIELKYQLKMIDDNERVRLYKEREQDRMRLLKVLDENGVWPQDNLRKSNYLYGEGYPEGMDEAVHRFLARSNSRAVILELENIFGVAELQNLPGTDRDKYPNWRHKLPLDLEDLATNADFVRNIRAVKTER